MKEFLFDLLEPLFILVIGVIIGLIKAYVRKSPLSKKEEVINFFKYLKKPALWSFVGMFSLVLILGVAGGAEPIGALKRSTIAGLYTSAGVFLFMIWGANLIKGD